MANEKYLQVPLDDGYFERLARRADENDRAVSREAARIIKDVLDVRYVLAAAVAAGVMPGMEMA